LELRQAYLKNATDLQSTLRINHKLLPYGTSTVATVQSVTKRNWNIWQLQRTVWPSWMQYNKSIWCKFSHESSR